MYYLRYKLLSFMASLLLKDYPSDIRKFVLKVQGEIKVEKNISLYSMEKVIYKLLREHPLFNKK